MTDETFPGSATGVASDGPYSDVVTHSSFLPRFRGPGGSLTLVHSARLLGHYRWIERRLFNVLGEWVGSQQVAATERFFDVQSRQHGWHADLWAERLPALDGVDIEALTVPPGPEVEKCLSVLSAGGMDDEPRDPGESAGGGTLLNLVGMARVILPRLLIGYRAHLGRCDSVADLSVIRTLRFVMMDEMEAWQEAEHLAQSLLHRPHDVAVVTSHQQQLESLLVGCGPGLVSLQAPISSQ